ncbi:MAG: ADOP family duplicated permease [Chthoniobacterales bacterium]
MNSLRSDILTALRFFARRKAASAVIVLTMALALAANTTAFSVLHAFLFGNLAVPNPDRVVLVPATKVVPGRGRIDFSDAYPNYLRLKSSTHSSSAFGAALQSDVNWAEKDDTHRLEGSRVTASFFDVMQVRPLMGRLFTAKEEGPHAAPVALVSRQIWRSAFNGDPGVIGRTLRLNGVLHTVIGVMPSGFAQPTGSDAGIDVWLPFDLPEAMWTNVTGARQISTYARLAPGATTASADDDLRTFAVRAREADPVNNEWNWRVQKLREQLLDGSGSVVVFVQSGAFVLLLLAICNLASVLIAWAAERERETAVRLALGASSWRIIRQFLVQNILLVSAGGILAICMASLVIPSLRYLNPNPSLAALLRHVEIDWTTIGFSALIVLGTGVLVGLLPALQTRSLSLEATLRSQARGGSANPAAVRWQKAMVTFQAAISVLILVCAALAGLGLRKVSQVKLGFDGANRVGFRIEFPEPAYAKHEQRVVFARTLQENLSKEPAVAASGLTTTLPVGDGQWGGTFILQLPTGEFTADPALLHYRRVSSGYLPAMGIPLIEGRMLSDRDRIDSPPVAVVSKAVAEKYWPGQAAIGHKIRRSSPPDSPVMEIVGVVGNVHDAGAALAPGETVYVPFEQASLRRAWVILNGRGSTSDTVAAGRRALRLTSSDVAAFGVAKLDALSWQDIALPRLQMVLFAVFALITVAITGLGTYGVMSQLVAIRQEELAIRTALGATPHSLIRAVLLQNARLATTGMIVGIATAWFTTRWLQSQLTSFDASTLWPFAIVAAGVLILTQLASFLPARRAMNLNLQSMLSGA